MNKLEEKFTKKYHENKLKDKVVNRENEYRKINSYDLGNAAES